MLIGDQVKSLRCTASALKIRELPEGVDTGARIIHGEVVGAYGDSYDQKWAFVKASAGQGWVSNDYLEEVQEVIILTPWPRIPNGLIEIRETFGEPALPICHSGLVTFPAKIGSVERFSCHTAMTPVFQSVFDQIYRKGHWSLIHTFDGCYNDRSARGLQKKSTHAWGISVDLNASENPLGARPVMDGRIISIFEDHGFLWGGRWARPDGMHFQRAIGY